MSLRKNIQKHLGALHPVQCVCISFLLYIKLIQKLIYEAYKSFISFRKSYEIISYLLLSLPIQMTLNNKLTSIIYFIFLQQYALMPEYQNNWLFNIPNMIYFYQSGFHFETLRFWLKKSGNSIHKSTPYCTFV